MNSKSTVLSMSVLLATVATSANTLTREELYSGLKIPEVREFPLSSKVSPCEDFHRYVCDEAEKSFKLPDDRSYWVFSFVDNSERLLHAKKKFFSKIQGGFNPEGKRIGQVKNFYLACMNSQASKSSERSEVTRLKKQIKDIQTIEQFQDFLQAQIDKPELSFISYESFSDQKDPNRSDVVLFGEVMSLPERSYYEKKEVVADLGKLMEAFFQEIKLSNPRKRAQEIVEFEKKMAQNFPLPAEIRERISTDTYKDREHFAKAYPNLKLDRFIQRVPKDTKIRDVTPEGMAFINSFLVAQNLETLKNIYLFHALGETMDDAYPRYFAKRFEFQRKHMGGPTKRPPRDERCTKLVMQRFSQEVDEYLIPILFPNFPREDVVNLVGKVRSSLLEDLKENKWLSKSAKSEASSKMKNAKLFLVQPTTDKEWDFNPIREYSATEPIANKKTLKLAMIEKELEELKSPRPRERWLMGPLTLNAYYNPPDNQFVLLQGILQPPFFGTKATEIENLGGIGAIVGHELGHGIDDQGSRYDSDGKLRLWMTEADLKAFHERGAQFIERFDAIGHNGKFTLGENIGDHVGLRSAYRAAFVASPKKHGVEEKKDFFKAYARLWCGVVRPDFEKVLLKTDPHALGPARINQQVIHLDGFYDAFQCKAGDKMFVAPEKRIKVW